MAERIVTSNPAMTPDPVATERDDVVIVEGVDASTRPADVAAGATLGGAGGVAAGAIIGAGAGPVGAAVGAVIGALAGSAVGGAMGAAVNSGEPISQNAGYGDAVDAGVAGVDLTMSKDTPDRS